VFPIFFTLIIGIIEFSLMFNALLSIGHATRDAALLGAEAGAASDADCLMLQSIESDLSAPVHPTQIQQVLIYRADENGNPISGEQDVYTRTGSTTCMMSDGSTVTVPYTASSIGYPPATRCDILAGAAGGCAAGRVSVDTIGVKITYQHVWVTPLPDLVSLNGSGATLVQSSAMRMEPML
jgi:hypothetical protein